MLLVVKTSVMLCLAQRGEERVHRPPTRSRGEGGAYLLSLSPTTYWVDDDGRGNGTSESSPAGNITYILETYDVTNAVIKVKPGVYNSSVEDFPLVIRCENITLESTGGPEVTIIKGERETGFNVTADHTMIRGFTISNFGNDWWEAGIRLNSRGNRITGNIINNNYYYGIYLRSSGNNIITNNTINNNEHGTRLSSSNNSIIANNTINNNRWDGIDLEFASSNNIITNNIIGNSCLEGIELRESGNNSITNNTISDTSNGIQLRNSGNNTITNNAINNTNGRYGLLIKAGSNSNRVLRNNISGCNYGILMRASTNNTLVQNDLRRNSVGFKVEGHLSPHYNHTIKDNTVSGGVTYYFYNREDMTFSTSNAGHLTFAYCKNITVTNSTVSGGDFLRFASTNNSKVTGSEVSKSSKGIFLENAKGNIITTNMIANNTLGIKLKRATNTIVVDCTILENEQAMSLSHSTDCIIRENTITNNIKSIRLHHSHDTLITGNNISHHGVMHGPFIGYNGAVFVELSNNTTIKNNILLHNIPEQIYIEESEYTLVQENKISECKWGDGYGGYGIFVERWHTAYLHDPEPWSPAGTVVVGNKITNNGGELAHGIQVLLW